MIYTVKKGDTLSKIAQELFGDMELWQGIAAMNSIGNSDVIYPGQQLMVPDVKPVTVKAKKIKPVAIIVTLSLVAAGGYYLYNQKKKRKK